MKLNTFLTIKAIVSIVYGLGVVLAPAILLPWYGFSPDPGTSLMAQFFGVELVGVGLFVWFARTITAPSTLRTILIAPLLADVLGALIALLGTLAGTLNAAGWSVVAIYLLFTVGIGYFELTEARTLNPSVQ